MYFKLLIGLLLFSSNVQAGVCDDIADRLQGQTLDKALPYYETCALSDNNDSAHMLLAKTYATGEKNIPINMQKALLFYHLAADNGNAQAQTELAKMLLKLDETSTGREQVQSYLRKVQAALRSQPSGAFQGELLHPYTLLLLAAERPDQKWYYPSIQTSFPEAGVLLKTYKIDDVKKRQALNDASAWKQKKMMQTAKEVLGGQEYVGFVQAVAPTKGKADKFAQTRAINDLKKATAVYRGN